MLAARPEDVSCRPVTGKTARMVYQKALQSTHQLKANSNTLTSNAVNVCPFKLYFKVSVSAVRLDVFQSEHCKAPYSYCFLLCTCVLSVAIC